MTPSMTRSLTRSMSVADAYKTCRKIARREAKNFFYAFRVLPKAKSDAMCAVYAFMRKADDLADDESMPVERRRAAMRAWLAEWRASQSGGSHDAVFIALADTQRRFDISDALLEELVQGTSMDISEADAAPGSGYPVALPGGLQGYRSFEDLYRYCYLVASVVGLVCIKVFGYSDPAAEALAEKTGIAFQLTNILRDVKEDAERGRIYLPQEMLLEFNVTDEDILALAHGRALRPHERALLGALSVQARQYYKAADRLIPMIDRDSRAAMWVLVTIYSELLKRIDLRANDVFSERVSVPTGAKLMILARGAAQAMMARGA
jgi:phytoene synthase